jgi:hypothetical protein
MRADGLVCFVSLGEKLTGGALFNSAISGELKGYGDESVVTLTGG